MVPATIICVVLFTYWAYYRVVYKQDKEAWTEIEVVAGLLLVFLVILYFILP
jgi:hypothetical protein